MLALISLHVLVMFFSLECHAFVPHPRAFTSRAFDMAVVPSDFALSMHVQPYGVVSAVKGLFRSKKKAKSLTINDKFPNLKGSTQSTDGFDLYDYLGDSWGIVFMHPGDFTPVCTTELGTAAKLTSEFDKRDVKLCGFSCNSAESHKGWIEDIKVVTGASVEFPLFCDPTRDFAVDLGVLDETNKDAKGLPMTVRSVFILKPDRTIALMMTYPASSGRNFDEILRAVDTLQLTAKHAVATPVDWKKGEDVIVNFPLSDSDADEKFGKDGYKIVDVPSEKGKDLPKHYMRFTKDPTK